MKYLSIVLLVLLLMASDFILAQNGRIWSTYYGGLANDGGFSVAADHSGNVYLAGITMSQNGISFNGFQNTFGGGVVDAFLVKFDSAGNRLWGTYYGGPGDEMAFFGGKMGIATDPLGNVFLAGLTSSTTGIAAGGFQNNLGGTAVNAYLVKFDAAGNRLWGTYYGGTSADKAYGVATDEAGNCYIAGIANSTGLGSGGFQNTSGGASDALLVKFDPNGNRIWATYYGGAGTEEGYSVATDAYLNVYLAGTTTSTSSIASNGAQNSYGGGSSDLFLVKFDSTGARQWATYYGGSGDEMFLFAGDLDVAADLAGNVYLAGLTTSTNNISFNGYQNNYGGGASDAFLVKFDAIGNRLWGTYYGGSGQDKGYHITTNAPGNIYLSGRTDSPNGIATGGFNNNYAGDQDAFLAKFDPDGSLLCATYFGATDVDECNSIAVDGADNVYLCGNTACITGISWNGFQNIHGGGTSDGFLVKFTSCPSFVAIDEIQETNPPMVFPNPAKNSFRIRGDFQSAEISLYDGLGSKIHSITGYQDATIEVPHLAPGLYFIRIVNGNESRTEKVMLLSKD